MNKALEIVNALIDAINDYEKETHIQNTGAYIGRETLVELQQALQRLEPIDNAIAICQKANEQKYVYIKESYGISKERFLDNLDYEVLNNRLYVNSRGIYHAFPLNDYGNWWALTKEELENE